MSSKWWNRALTIAAAGMAATAIAACGNQTISDPGTSYSSSQPPMATRYVENSYVTDINDLRKLAGLADAIFVGKVVNQQGTKALGPIPETQFRVNVIDTLKGQLGSTVTVNQQGGIDQQSKEVVLVEGDKLIEAGKNYLFATRYLPSEDWYTLIPVVGDRLLTDQQAAAANPQARASQPKLIVDMRAAIANQIPFADGSPRATGAPTSKPPVATTTPPPGTEEPPVSTGQSTTTPAPSTSSTEAPAG